MKKRLNIFLSKIGQRGTTLIELILYIGIFSILLLVFLQIFTTILDLQQESQATTSVSQDGQFILARLTNDIKKAKTINTPANLNEPSSQLEIVVDGEIYTYELNGEKLSLTKNLEANSLNGYDTKATNLNFLRLGNVGGKQTITVTFTLTSNAVKNSGPEIKDFKTTIGLR